MFLTHCTIGWMLLAVLSVGVPVWSSMKVMQPYRVVSTNGAAQIHCVIHPRTAFPQNHPDQNLENPFFNADVRVILLRGLHGSQKVCSSTLNISEQQETQQEKDGDVKCAVQIKGGAVEMALSGLKATHTDIYRCGIQILYPPPYQQLTGNGTLLHVLESPHCPVQEPQRQQGQEEEEENLETKTAVSIPVVILVIAIICVLVVIITFQTLQCQQGRREPVRMPPNILLQKVDAVPFSSGTMA